MIAEYRCAYCGKEKTATDKEKPLLLEGERVCADCHQTHRGVPASNPIPKKPSPWASKGTRKRGAVPGLVKGSAGAHPRPEPVESYAEMQRRVEGTRRAEVDRENENDAQRSADDRAGAGQPGRPGPAVGASFESGRKPGVAV